MARKGFRGWVLERRVGEGEGEGGKGEMGLWRGGLRKKKRDRWQWRVR